MATKKGTNEAKAAKGAQAQGQEGQGAAGRGGDASDGAGGGQQQASDAGSGGAFGAPIPGIDAPAVKEPMIPDPSKLGDVPVVATKPAAAVPAVRARVEASPELIERAAEARESLETFSGITLPLVRFKEDFEIVEGEDHVDEFEGVLLFTKESNVYYANRFKMGSREMPTCFSPDGKVPTVENPQAPRCDICSMNKFGSAKEGEGKACKNTRPVFISVYREGNYGVIPKVLRVPPTSLTIIKNYIVACAADYGAYYAVRTKFRAFKRSQDQTHYNIGFSVAARLDAQAKADMAHLRQVWMPLMSTGNFGVEESELQAEAPAAPKAADTPQETDF